MTQSTQPISPLRQRMIEDMHMRKLAPKTQASYICAVYYPVAFTAFGITDYWLTPGDGITSSELGNCSSIKPTKRKLIKRGP
jgi:hypothetical protein